MAHPASARNATDHAALDNNFPLPIYEIGSLVWELTRSKLGRSRFFGGWHSTCPLGREAGGGRREAGSGKREAGGGKREEGRGKRRGKSKCRAEKGRAEKGPGLN